MILDLLDVQLDEDATSADRLRAIYDAARAVVPSMMWNALRLMPKAGEVLQGIDAWLETATPEQAHRVLDVLEKELDVIRLGEGHDHECNCCGYVYRRHLDSDIPLRRWGSSAARREESRRRAESRWFRRRGTARTMPRPGDRQTPSGWSRSRASTSRGACRDRRLR